MGLHVTSVAEIALKTEGIQGVDYFVYFLNYYQISDDVVDAFIKEIPALEGHFSQLGNAVLVTAIKNTDFYSEVLSWHNIVGLDAEVVCPCLLICTLAPSEFNRDEPQQIRDGGERPWVILELRKCCSTAEDLRELLKNVVSAISRGEGLKEFEEKEVFNYGNRPIITGRPKVYGVTFDFGSAFQKVKRKIVKRKQSLPTRYSDED